MSETKRNNIFSWINKSVSATARIFAQEFSEIFRHRGVLIIIVLAPLIYPFLYSYLYKNETVIDMPIAVIDESSSEHSREFTRHLDATRDVEVVYKLNNLEQAKIELAKGNIHGIVHIPREFEKNIVNGNQATVSMYCDMRSFLFYRAMVLSVNYVTLDMGKEIELERLYSLGESGELAETSIKPIPNESTILYNPGMGFASFVLPALLILIIHQTLVFGIGMYAGIAREDNPNGELFLKATLRGGLFREIVGRALCYFIVYLFWTSLTLLVVPRIFNLPHIGDMFSLLMLVVPFLFATIFFAMFLSIFVYNRETQMVLLVFFSVILLFLSGFSWPLSNMSGFWRVFGYLFPSTFAIQGYIKVNSMAATHHAINFEIIGLWIQTLVYFVLASIFYFMEMKRKKSVVIE